ncbi:pyridoxal-phosphate dependent enzyme [Formosa sediminum]|uniref:Pyridoxal-phosphate dependent enzyme n=1 Tax=Formosa sediminum TaxID=2594004 RepID=A0A516GU52_9FLAO|nr:pyridoxal-phosphate dependent enzyme [Formosa sediminum]QDO95056.1 pyridoxal-phosphate dependent enzyme [Formosa sediminum]
MEHKNQVFDNVLHLVEETPLIKLNKITSQFNGEFYVKVEAFNPSNSSKDRIALYILEQAEKQGHLKPNNTVIVTSFGDSGFNIAKVSLIKSYDCVVVVSSRFSKSKINLLKTMGARVYVCAAHLSLNHPKSYYNVAKQLQIEIKDSMLINESLEALNIDLQYKSSGPEIWKQTAGKITHLVMCSWFGEAMINTAMYLKAQNPNINILGVDVFSSVINKTKISKAHEDYTFAKTIGKNVTALEIIDEFVNVAAQDSTQTAKCILETEGLYVGHTSGAAMQAVLQLGKAGRFSKTDVVVAIFPDQSTRYINRVSGDTWREDQRYLMSMNRETIEKNQYIK